jgi:hypothetical protein
MKMGCSPVLVTRTPAIGGAESKAPIPYLIILRDRFGVLPALRLPYRLGDRPVPSESQMANLPACQDATLRSIGSRSRRYNPVSGRLLRGVESWTATERSTETKPALPCTSARSTAPQLSRIQPPVQTPRENVYRPLRGQASPAPSLHRRGSRPPSRPTDDRVRRQSSRAKSMARVIPWSPRQSQCAGRKERKRS